VETNTLGPTLDMYKSLDVKPNLSGKKFLLKRIYKLLRILVIALKTTTCLMAADLLLRILYGDLFEKLTRLASVVIGT
jgi:hypothetical protein